MNKKLVKMPKINLNMGKFINQIDGYKDAIKQQQAFDLYNCGNLDEAKFLCENILKINPKQLDVLQLLGTIYIHQKQWYEANNIFNIALEIDYTNPYLSNNRGNVLKELNLFVDALKNYDEAIKFKPDYSEAFFNRGVLLHELKRYKEALSNYDMAIKYNCDYSLAYYNRSIALQELNFFDEALSSYDKVIQFFPDSPDIYLNRGRVLIELDRLEEALDNYDKAINLDPNNAEAYSNRGVVLNYLKRWDESLFSIEKAIKLNPNFAAAYSNRGLVFFEKNFMVEALENFDKAIVLMPDYSDAYSNRGNVLKETMNLEAALTSYEKAIEIKNDNAQAHYNKAITLLLMGNLGNGFLEYEWRWLDKQINKVAGKRSFCKPLWLGSEVIANKTILLWCEQGLGDVIHFCRYTKLVKDLGARVVVEVPKPLIKLLMSLEGVDLLIEKGRSLPHFDFHCPLMSLPLSFKTELHTIPNSVPYIFSNIDKTELWNQRIGKKTKKRIGLVWSGSTWHKNDNNRSLSFENIIEKMPCNFEYICLQKEVRDSDKTALSKSNIKYYGELLFDFTDTVALCGLMDLVISVDTSIAHLAGALGKKTWILLPYIPDWRWLLDRQTTPWYNSVKLYRQTENRSYEQVLERIALDLQIEF